MDRKFVPDEKAEKYARIFGISTSDNDNEIDDTDDEMMKEHIWFMLWSGKKRAAPCTALTLLSNTAERFSPSTVTSQATAISFTTASPNHLKCKLLYISQNKTH